MYKAILIFGLCFFVSCMRDNDDISYRMNIDIVIKENDSLRVFYKTDGTINFNEKESFWIPVKGNPKNQKVIIKFPDSIFPKQLRLDFGKNKNVGEIVINKFDFEYKDNKFSAKGNEIYRYFRIDNSNTILNKTTGTLLRKDSLSNQGPSLYPNGYYLAVKLDELKYKK